MSGALFVLAIMLSVSVTMATAFLAIALFDTRNVPARWFALAFAVGALSAVGEYFISAGILVGFSRMVAALAMLAALLIVTYGLMLRAGLEREWIGLATIFAASSILYYLILDLPREDFLRQMLYQLPYALVSVLALSAAWRIQQRKPLDWVLIGLLTFTSVHFLFKPYLAEVVGGVGQAAEDYISTAYALISQTTGSILSLSVGVVLLLLIASDSALRFIRRAERDTETGFFNARGFADRVARHLQGREQKDMTMILFSAEPTNRKPSTAQMAAVVRAIETNALAGQDLGRMSEFDFALFDPEANLFAARRQAEILLKALVYPGRQGGAPLVVSVGITECEPGDGVSDMLTRAQWALEEARRSGGNCVRLAARSRLSNARRPQVS